MDKLLCIPVHLGFFRNVKQEPPALWRFGPAPCAGPGPALEPGPSLRWPWYWPRAPPYARHALFLIPSLLLGPLAGALWSKEGQLLPA